MNAEEKKSNIPVSKSTEYKNVKIFGISFEIKRSVFRFLSRKSARVMHLAAMGILALATVLTSVLVIKILSVFAESVPVMTVLSMLTSLVIFALGGSVLYALKEEHTWNFGGS